MKQHLTDAKILPAVTFTSVKDALPVAGAIRDGGLSIMEVALRTTEAFNAIKAIADRMPEIYLGAGTVLNIAQLKKAKAAGAKFALSPGFNRTVVLEAAQLGLPFIPGVMTPSEIEAALELGCSVLKLFPAAQAGGVALLKALRGPYGGTGVQFIPMGGLNRSNMTSYLNLDNVVAVGGSWLATAELINAGNYEAIRLNTIHALQSLQGDQL